jgi:hypothetical protein
MERVTIQGRRPGRTVSVESKDDSVMLSSESGGLSLFHPMTVEQSRELRAALMLAEESALALVPRHEADPRREEKRRLVGFDYSEELGGRS